MAGSKVQVTEGSGKNVATFSFTEDGVTKEAQRVAIVGSDGSATGTSTNPQYIQFPGVSLDAFYRLRIANPETVFDNINEYRHNTRIFEDVTSGTGSVTHLSNESSCQLSTGGTASGAKAYTVTREYFRYQPGKSQLILMTGVMGALKTNVRQRIGYFDTNNGLFFEQDGTNLKVVRRTKTSGSPVDNAVTQANWNVDKCDGTGSSGFNLDTSKTQIFFIDFEWLGVGSVRMGFFNEYGIPVVCHQFRNANTLTSVYMTTPNLPVQCQIENTGIAASTTTMKQICISVISEGGFEEERAAQFSVNNAATQVAVTTRRAILSFRPKATYNSITNRTVIRPIHMEITTKNNDCLWELVYAPVFTGTPVWNDVDTTNSAVEYSIHSDAALGAFTNGLVVDSGYSPSAATASARSALNADVTSRYPITLDASGANPIAFSLVCTSLASTSNNLGVLCWKEFK